MWIIGPEVPAAAFRFTPGEPVQWVLPTELDGLVAPVAEFAEHRGADPLPVTATGARTTEDRWAFTLDAASTAVLADARMFRVRDGETTVLAGPLRPRGPYSPDVSNDVTTTTVYIPGPQWVEVAPGLWST